MQQRGMDAGAASLAKGHLFHINCSQILIFTALECFPKEL